jgi:Spy/CpxP family protein refolding chaperone
MILKSSIAVALVALLAGVGSYVATVSSRQRTESRRAEPACDVRFARWLSLTPEQQHKIEAADPSFAEESRRLREESDAAREALATILTKDAASDQEILAATERAIEAHARLERRVTEHLLKVRTILTPEQRRRLFELSADQVRQGGGRGHGYGGPPEGRGGGGGGGRGRGHGRGPAGGGGGSR